MRKTLFLALAVSILASAWASNNHSTSVNGRKRMFEPDQQVVHISSPRKVPKLVPADSLFALLPRDIVLLVFQLVPFQHLALVCHEWTHITQKRRLPSLRCLFMTPSFERCFKSEEGRDRALCEIIAFHFADSPKGQLGLVAEDWGEPMLQELLMGATFDCTREKGRLVGMLSSLPNSNPKGRLLQVLSGVGSFSKLPLCVRQLATGIVWPSPPRVKPVICSLSIFLSSFHGEFDAFKDSLVSIHHQTIVQACVEILFGIDCAELSVQDRGRLLDWIKALFPENALLGVVCSLHDILSPSSSIVTIFGASECSRRLKHALSNVLKHS